MNKDFDEKELKDKKLEDALEECLDLVRTNKETVQDCLSRYPNLREKLEPLLRAAVILQATPSVEPSPEFRVRTRQALIEKVSVPAAVAARRLRPRRLLMQLVAAALIFLLIVGGIAAASTSALPTSPLYPVKLGIEKVQLALATSDAARANLRIRFAERRLDELQEMVKLKESRAIQRIANAINKETGEAFEETRNLSGTDKDVLLDKLVNLTERQQAVLQRVYDKAPEEAKAALLHAQEVSRRGHERAAEALRGIRERKIKPEEKFPAKPPVKRSPPGQLKKGEGTPGKSSKSGHGSENGRGTENSQGSRNFLDQKPL
ncbi:MAG: DUF5667 domain-containing protein [Actinomycetota bacterium]